jgi:cytochrome c553
MTSAATWMRVSAACSLGTLVMAVILLAVTRARADNVETLAGVCVTCHGVAGLPIDPAIPVIWGQNEGYLYLQLRDMKRGARKVDAMAPIVDPLERSEMLALAAYFAAKPWPNLAQPGASDADTRRALQANTSIGCTGCHLAGYLAAGTVPRLAGQQRAYLAKTMADFRDGARGNNPGMTDLMKVAAPEDLAALASFLSGL